MINDNDGRKGISNHRNHLLSDAELLRKEELAQRRKIRIQQVRIQSKDIANNVLRHIRIEKTQHRQFVQIKEEDLFKKWQDRKIFELNLVYKENINKLGSGCRAAEAEPDPEKEISELSNKNTGIAKIRGKKAFDQLKTEEEVSQIKRETLAAQRDKVKKLEGLRAALIASLPHPKTKRKPTQKPRCIHLRVASPSDESEQGKSDEEHFNAKSSNSVIPMLHMDTTLTDRRGDTTSYQTSRKTASCLDHPTSAVQVYDRSNPCTYTMRQPISVRVERTSPESQKNAREVAEMEEKAEAERQTKRDNEEEMRLKRGKKALAKEMVRKDFQQLVSSLDGLARKERVVRASAPPQLPLDMFMDERRCALRAQRRQRNLDSVFEGVFHGNEGVGLRGASSVEEEDTHPIPLRVEQVELPVEWQDMRQHILQSPGTPPEKLNVGIYDKDTNSLYGSDIVTKDSTNIKDPSLKETERGSDAFGYPETVRELYENNSKQDDGPTLAKDNPKNKTCAPGKVLPMDTSPTVATVTSNIKDHLKGDDRIYHLENSIDGDEEEEVPNVKDVDRGSFPTSSHASRKVTEGLSAIQEQDEHDDAGCSSDIRMKPESTAKSEACTQTVDMARRQESHPSIEDVYIHRMEMSSVINETEGSSASSHSPSSVKIEEVRVVLKFNEVSPKDISVEEEAQLPCTISRKQRKKRGGYSEQRKKVTLNDEVETVIGMDAPDAKLVTVEGKKEAEAELSVDAATKPERRKKRVKKDHQKTKPSSPLSTSDSSYPSPLSHQEIFADNKSKALLQKIRAQRKLLEKWEGLKERDDDKTSAPLGTYVQKLLSMTRESIAELSVSDVSTPSIHLTSPLSRPDLDMPVNKGEVSSRSEMKHREKSLVSKLKKVDRGTSPLPVLTESPEERITVPKFQETIIDYPFEKMPRSSLETASAKSSTDISLPSSSTSLGISSSQETETSERQPSPPSPPPPSPEYEQLSDLHSRRISLLGAKLSEVREVQKKLLSFSSSFESDIQRSSSSSLSSSAKVCSISSEKSSSSSKKSDDYESKKYGGLNKSWDLSEISLSMSGESEDISFHENVLLESLRIIEPEESSKKSQEETFAKRKSGHKSGPPPTPLKGVRWSAIDNQIPHELSTITEVDSKLISATSIMEPRKENDSVASISSTKMKLPANLISKPKSPEIDYTERTGTQPAMETSDFWKTARKKGAPIRSPVSQKSLPLVDIVEPTPETIEEPVKITSEPIPEKVASDITATSSSTSIEGDASYSSQYPSNLDDALRLLGISPTIFKRPDSPLLAEMRSPLPVETALADETTQQSTLTKDFSIQLPHSDVKIQGEDVLEPNKDVGSHDVEQVSFPSREMINLSHSCSIRKFLFESKDSHTPIHQLLHSTPVHSTSTGTSSSSSDSHHKNLSGFPFLGESAPSSISGSGTPFGSELRNKDDSVGLTKD